MYRLHPQAGLCLAVPRRLALATADSRARLLLRPQPRRQLRARLNPWRLRPLPPRRLPLP